MKIIITGASGYVGSHIARRLVALGHDVRALARSPRAVEAVESLGATAVDGHLGDLKVLQAAAGAADAVVHAAVDYSHPDMAQVEAAALRAFSDSGAPLIYLSSGLVYPDSPHALTEDAPVSAHGAAQPFKLAGERAALNHGGTAVRAGLVHGHGGSALLEALLSAGRERGVVPFVAGSQAWSTVHVDDVARLVEILLDRAAPGEVFNAAAPEPVEIATLAADIAEATGATPLPLSLEQAFAINPAVALLARNVVLDAGKAGRVLGWHADGPTLRQDLLSPEYGVLQRR